MLATVASTTKWEISILYRHNIGLLELYGYLMYIQKSYLGNCGLNMETFEIFRLHNIINYN